MKADKKTIAAIVLGIVAVIIVLYQVMGAFPSTTNAVTSAVAAPTPSPIVSASQTAAASVQVASVSTSAVDYASFIATVKEDNLPFKSKIFRNPMTPLVSDQKPDEPKASGPAAKVALGPSDALSMGYTIEGIVWNDADPLAIIDNQVVGVGEMLDDGSIVTEISPDTVRFTKQGTNYFLVFREE
jgi:hypothetical protein